MEFFIAFTGVPTDSPNDRPVYAQSGFSPVLSALGGPRSLIRGRANSAGATDSREACLRASIQWPIDWTPSVKDGRKWLNPSMKKGTLSGHFLRTYQDVAKNRFVGRRRLTSSGFVRRILAGNDRYLFSRNCQGICPGRDSVPKGCPFLARLASNTD